MKPEIGKWYIVRGYEDRGPGEMMGDARIVNYCFGLEHKKSFLGGHDFGSALPNGIDGHCWFYQSTCTFTEVPDPTAKPITEFKSGHWYRWIGPKERPDWFTSSGSMDFILDGKPHQCSGTSIGTYPCASFFDCVDSGVKWSWEGPFLVECDPPEENKTREHNLVDSFGRVKPIMFEPLGGLIAPISLESKKLEAKLFEAKKVSGPFTEVKKTKILSRAQRRKDVLSRLKID